MVRRIVLGALVGTLVVAGIAAQGCYIGASGGSNCDPKVPIKCCQCPLPEACPPYAEPEPIPDWCAPYLIDAGCPELYIYDRSICEPKDGGTDGDDGGMSSVLFEWHMCSSGSGSVETCGFCADLA